MSPLVSPLSMRVVHIDVLTPRIRRFLLVHADGSPLPDYTPGAHIEIHIPLGPGCPAMHRAYSLVKPADGGVQYEIAVQLEADGSGGSRWMHDLQGGATLTVSAPRNQFPLVSAARSHLLLAGGIGITPLLCMARALAAENGAFAFYYAAREREQAAYALEVEALGGQCWFDGGNPAQGMPLAAVIGPVVEGRHVYVCGPQGYIRAVLETARDLGWPETQLHCELFSGALGTANEQAFTVYLPDSDMTLEVPVDRTVMEVMEAAGLEPLFDCRRGDCGICVAQVKEGVADHRDICLSESERAAGRFCICVSRAHSERLVLEM